MLEFSMLKPADEAVTALSAAEWCSLLIPWCRVRGPSTAVSELHSSLAIPTYGLVCAVLIYATSRKSAGSSTHRAASPQMYLHPWRSRQ